MAQSSTSHKSDKSVPLATAVKRDTLRKLRVELQDLPAALFLVGESELPRGASLNEGEILEEVEAEELPLEASSEALESKEESGTQEPDENRFNEKEQQEEEIEGVALNQASSTRSQSSINRRALDSTNRGKKPSSRTFVRGILHPSSVKVFFAALFAILSRLSFFPVLAISLLVLFEKIPPVFLWGVIVFPLLVFLNIVTSLQVRCRVCGMREFVPSKSHKHRDTHSFFRTGPIISTAVHVILFRWFRCMFCGTPIRTKK